ncbi:MAG TPA: histidine kinase [Gemmatimonadales bacterium]|nr:histidine kinase [Gemmatimonadales bacterium]
MTLESGTLPARRRIPVLLLLLGVWTVPALISAAQSYFLLAAENQRSPMFRQILLQLPLWWYWVLATPVIAWVLRRWPLDRGVRVPSIAVHAVVATASALVHSALITWMSRMVAVLPAGETMPAFRTWFMGYLRSRFQFELLIYVLVALGLMAVTWYRRLQERDLAASRLEAQLSDAELRALKMQLHPHFLFNTLHAISVLIRQNPAAAQRTVTLLGDLLRSTLATAGVQVVTLREELTFLRRYLEIEEIRFEDRLRVRFEIDPALEECLVPNLILQPLVENAVRHAVEPSLAAGVVTVRARDDQGTLELAVLDDGPGVAGGPGGGNGIGLATTRARLEGLYGERGVLTLTPRDEGGLAVLVRIPLRRKAA